MYGRGVSTPHPPARESEGASPTTKWIVYAGTISHQRDSLEQALWLAQSLARHSYVEVEEWRYDDDPLEGWVWNSEVVATYETGSRADVPRPDFDPRIDYPERP